MPKRPIARRVWTDKAKEDLLRTVEPAVEAGQPLKHALAKVEINDSWYRRMRSAYLKAHPRFNPVSSSPREPVQETTKALAVRHAPVETSFLERPDAEKLRLLHEYNQLTLRDKDPWRKRYRVSSASLSYYRTHLKPKKSPDGSVAGIPPENRRAMVEEYLHLTGIGAKSAWLKQHNLNHQSIHEMKKREGMLKRQQAEPQSVKEFYDKKPSVNGALVPAQIHTHSPVTLDDAILAMEVKRDQLNLFIDDLKRMSRGQR